MELRASTEIILFSMVMQCVNDMSSSLEDDERVIQAKRIVTRRDKDKGGDLVSMLFICPGLESGSHTVGLTIVESTFVGEVENLSITVQFAKEPVDKEIPYKWHRTVLALLEVKDEDLFFKGASSLARMVTDYLRDGTEPPIAGPKH